MSDMAAVWAALKSGALDVATRELGVHIDKPTQAWLNAKRRGPKHGSPPVVGLVNAIIEARVADSGYAVVEIPIGLHYTHDEYKYFCLGVRMKDKVVAGYATAKKRKNASDANYLTVVHAWPELAGWGSGTQKNRKLAQAWARSTAKKLDRHEVKIIESDQPIDENEEAALLAQIVADPDDLAPRHVYADWLIARNDIRGECIALLLLPKLDKKAQKRLSAIYKEASRAIEGDIPDHGGFAFMGSGMIDKIYIDAAKLMRHGERWFARHPITHVKITGGKPKEVAACTVLPKIRTLALDLEKQDFTPVWESKAFTSLERLELEAIGIKPSPKGLANLALLRAPKLRSIRFYCVDGVDRALAALAANKTLPKLETVEVNNGGDDGDQTFTPATLRAKSKPTRR